MATTGTIGTFLSSIIFGYIASEVLILSAVTGLAFLYVSIRMIYEGSMRRAPLRATPGNFIPGKGSSKGAIGLIVGILTGILGLGGGYALVPSFIYIFKAPVKLAVGTSLPSFIGMALVSAGFKWYQGYVSPLAALLLGLGTALGAQLGAKLVGKLPSWLIKLMFGAVFLYISLKFILRSLGMVI